jgi:hypothetical protein
MGRLIYLIPNLLFKWWWTEDFHMRLGYLRVRFYWSKFLFESGFYYVWGRKIVCIIKATLSFFHFLTKTFSNWSYARLLVYLHVSFETLLKRFWLNLDFEDQAYTRRCWQNFILVHISLNIYISWSCSFLKSCMYIQTSRCIKYQMSSCTMFMWHVFPSGEYFMKCRKKVSDSVLSLLCH